MSAIKKFFKRNIVELSICAGIAGLFPVLADTYRQEAQDIVNRSTVHLVPSDDKTMPPDTVRTPSVIDLYRYRSPN